MKLPVVVNTDDVARVRRIHVHAFVCHEGKCVSNLHFAAFTQVLHLHAGGVATGTHAEKSDTVAVARIHVGLNLEDEPRKRFFRGFHDAHTAVAGLGLGRPIHERLQHVFHTEIIHTGTEEDGTLLTREEFLEIKGFACTLDELDRFAHRADFHREEFVQTRIVESFDHFAVAVNLFRTRGEAVQTVV